MEQLDGIGALESAARVRPRGELDFHKAPGFEHDVMAALEDEPAEVVLDLRAVTMLDSIGLRSLFRACFWCEQRGVTVRIVPGGPAVRRILRATGADEWLPVREEAPEP